MPYLVRSACLTGYAELARSLGLDPFLLLKEAGLDRDCLFHPDSKISVDGVRRLWEVSARAARIDDFGLRLAEARPLSFLGPISLAVRDAATLREALKSASRYLPLHHEGVTLSLEKMGGLAICKLEVLDGHSPARQSMEVAVGVTHRLIRRLLGDAWRPRPVWFSHSAPADMTTYISMFGPWVELGRDCSGILLEASDLDAPLPASDPMLERHVKQQYLEPMLAQVSVTLSKKVRQLVYELLPSGRCSVEQLASRLVMHPRTLHRYLAREGETCSSIVDAVRGDLARRYVEDQGRSLSEVSDLLGFSALSSFSRWFHTRFSCSPMSWRAARNPRLRASDQSA